MPFAIHRSVPSKLHNVLMVSGKASLPTGPSRGPGCSLQNGAAWAICLGAKPRWASWYAAGFLPCSSGVSCQKCLMEPPSFLELFLAAVYLIHHSCSVVPWRQGVIFSTRAWVKSKSASFFSHTFSMACQDLLVDTAGLCNEVLDFSCICRLQIGRTNPIEAALLFLGNYQSVVFISFYLPLLSFRPGRWDLFPFSSYIWRDHRIIGWKRPIRSLSPTIMLHPGVGCSGAGGKIQCFWRKLLDFAQNN